MKEKNLIIINDAPYGTEKAYNALRLANTILSEHEETEIKVFLLADAVFCGLPNQKTPNGFYNIERLMKSVLHKGAEIKLCGGCSEARGIHELQLIDSVQLSNMKQLAKWTTDCDKVLTF